MARPTLRLIDCRLSMESMKIPLFVCCAGILCLSAGSAHAQVTPSQIYQGLVSYWPMDTLNTSGGVTTTPDVISGLNLTAPAGPTSTTTGQFGSAIQLNGTSQYLVVTNFDYAGGYTNNLNTGLPYFAGTPFTVAFWVKAATPTAADRYLFAMGCTTNSGPLYCLQSGHTAGNGYSNLDVIVRPIQNNPPINHYYTTNGILNGNWHHVAWVDNYGVVSVYVDGALQGNSPGFSYFPKQLISPNAINSSSGGAPLFQWVIPLNTASFGALVRNGVSYGPANATYDDAGVWNRALSQAEVQYIYNNGIPAYSSSLHPGYPGFAVALPSRQTNAMGDYVWLSANAYGAPPLSLQWYEDSAAIPNATNQLLAL